MIKQYCPKMIHYPIEGAFTIFEARQAGHEGLETECQTCIIMDCDYGL